MGLKETHSNALLNNPWVQEEVTMEIGKYFVLDKNENRNKSKLVRMQLKEYWSRNVAFPSMRNTDRGPLHQWYA